MTRLVVSLLGPMEVLLNGQAITGFNDNKMRGLLAYLVLKPGRQHARKELADLLWPDAKNPTDNLRNALSKLRREVLNDQNVSASSFFTNSDHVVQFNLAAGDEVDVNTLEELLKACRKHSHRRLQCCHSCRQLLEQAAGLYQGEFLEGLLLDGNERWQEFVMLNREHYRRLTYEALMNLAIHHELLQEYDVAETYAQRWITLEPLDEDAYRLLMRVLAFQGKRRVALNQYELLRRALETAEFNLEPETVMLYEQIRIGRLIPPAPIMHKLPAQATRFLGRERELADITSSLEDPQCRLVNLVGPGGIGKTRLAIAAADSQRGVFADGIYFVSCASVQSPQALVTTIAGDLGFALEGPEDPAVQLLDYLGSKEILLVLDNLEHLLDTALVNLLIQIERQAPQVSILATSRERLNLTLERPVPVEGLEVPLEDQIADVEHFSAVQLFVERACRVQPTFVLQDKNRAVVVNICRMLEGMPLAIELAANWVRCLPINRIEKEIAEGLKFLHTPELDVPERHRSMRFVFDHSYHLLSSEEQIVFCQLSVFRGGFTLEAAEEVAGATPPMLKSLVDKSLLRLKEDRYELHELLRQYAGDKLDTNETNELRGRHVDYYANLAKRLGRKITTSEMFAALNQLDHDLDNLRAALNWSHINLKRFEAGTEILAETFFYWYFRNLWSEGRNWSEKFIMLPGIEQETTSWARVLTVGGGLAWLQGDNHIAGSRLAKSVELLRRNKDVNNLAYTLAILGYNSLSQGDIVSAEEHITESVTLFRKSDDEWGLGMAVTALGEVLMQHTKYEAARKCFDEGMTISVRQNHVGIGYIRALLGKVLRHQGDYAGAKSESENALALARTYGVKRFMALALENLGRTLNAQHEPAQAARSFAEGILMFEAVKDLAGVAMCIEGSAATQLLFKKPAFAAWLLGAANALRERIQVPVFLVDQVDYDHTMSNIRTLIDEITFDSAWKKGHTAPVEYVIAVITGDAEKPDF
jgi:predicted ATPase/DNA-binding SARP family transcriptional activator/GNAT superfamily N-acetyltransferase